VAVVGASANTWAVRFAVLSITCTAFVIATLVAGGDWGIGLSVIWVIALAVAVLASVAAPIAALRSSLSPFARAVVFACSLPALVFLALLAYFFIVVLPTLT
jgi:hypothetical protein